MAAAEEQAAGQAGEARKHLSARTAAESALAAAQAEVTALKDAHAGTPYLSALAIPHPGTCNLPGC